MVIDSHVLFWWFERPQKLSPKARTVLAGLDDGSEEFVVSAVTFWEMRYKELRGKFTPITSVAEWPRLVGKLPNLHIEDVDAQVWLATAELRWSHRDPADRIIAATARKLGLQILTIDHRFHEEDSPVAAVW